MWSLRQKSDGELYLTFDRSRHYNPYYRGLWEVIGPQNNLYTEHLTRINRNAGYLCANDDEGSVRILVLEE